MNKVFMSPEQFEEYRITLDKQVDNATKATDSRLPVLERYHIRNGRTFRNACNSGTFYSLRSEEFGVPLEYWQATSPEETLELALTDKWLRKRIHVGMVFLVNLYLPQSQIGAMHAWACGTVQIESINAVTGIVTLRRLDWQEYPGHEELNRRLQAR